MHLWLIFERDTEQALEKNVYNATLCDVKHKTDQKT